MFLISAVVCTGIKKYEAPNENHSAEDGTVKAIKTDPSEGNVYGSRNFEYLVSVQESGKDVDHTECCLESAHGEGRGLVTDENVCLGPGGEAEGEAELKRLLSTSSNESETFKV